VVGAVVSITGVSSTVTSFGTTVRSDLVLQNENHMFLDISLWSDIARNLNGQELAVLGRSGPVMLAVCSLRVTGATKGGYSLTSTPGTRCVLNPVSEMAHLVQSVFFASTNTCQYYPPRFATPNEAAAFEAECTKTVSQLLALCFPPVADSTRYHCSGRIVSVDSSMQWYYLGCALCSKAAIDYDGVDKWCDDHRRLVPQQTQNFYKLRVTVDDNTGSAAFVLLGRAADLLVGLTANDLSTRFPYQRNVLPQELLALEGRDFTFDVQLPKPEYGARGPPEFTVLAVNEQEQPNSCSPTLGRRARNAMPHTPPPNSPHLMPLTSPYVVPTMQNASVEHGSSVASPSGSSQLAFSTPPRRPYSSRRIAAVSSPSSAALGSSVASSPELGRTEIISYARSVSCLFLCYLNRSPLRLLIFVNDSCTPVLTAS
ncbi:unnamed protein product, partial [Linum tenue]